MRERVRGRRKERVEIGRKRVMGIKEHIRVKISAKHTILYSQGVIHGGKRKVGVTIPTFRFLITRVGYYQKVRAYGIRLLGQHESSRKAEVIRSRFIFARDTRG
jgi:hypothetical protein